MKRVYIIAIYVLFGLELNAQNSNGNSLLPTGSNLEAVKKITTSEGSGTCFIINDSTKTFLITAKHMFKKGIKSGSIVDFQILVDGKNIPARFPVFFDNDSIVDIAVIKIPKETYNMPAFPLKGGDMLYGQECFFLGFPLGFGTPIGTALMPLYKRAVFSGIADTTSNAFIFDAHNNAGFSGGPIVTADKNHQYVVAIISGYFYESKEFQISQLKNETEAEKTAIFRENSGLMIAYSFSNVSEIIKQNNL